MQFPKSLPIEDGSSSSSGPAHVQETPEHYVINLLNRDRDPEITNPFVKKGSNNFFECQHTNDMIYIRMDFPGHNALSDYGILRFEAENHNRPSNNQVSHDQGQDKIIEIITGRPISQFQMKGVKNGVLYVSIGF